MTNHYNLTNQIHVVKWSEHITSISYSRPVQTLHYGCSSQLQYIPQSSHFNLRNFSIFFLSLIFCVSQNLTQYMFSEHCIANKNSTKRDDEEKSWAQEEQTGILTSGVDPVRKMLLQCATGIHTQHHSFICSILITALYPRYAGRLKYLKL